jgi:hypothetical protein
LKAWQQTILIRILDRNFVLFLAPLETSGYEKYPASGGAMFGPSPSDTGCTCEQPSAPSTVTKSAD